MSKFNNCKHFILYLILLTSTIFGNSTLWEYKISMPGMITDEEDSYICVNFDAPSFNTTVFIKEIIPHANSLVVHHMILRGCAQTPSSFNEINQCGVCNLLLYAWARNAPGLKFPTGVGLPVGRDVEIKGFQLEVHYLYKVDLPDHSGLSLLVTREVQPRIAGVFLLLKNNAFIPPESTHITTDISCRIQSNLPITIMAIRGHAHSLGRSVIGYRLPGGQGPAKLLGHYNPQWPQAFYPIKHLSSDYDAVELSNSDIIMARCVYDSTGRKHATRIGLTHHDEMCNLYLLYHTSPFNTMTGDDKFCFDDQFEDKWQLIPENATNYASNVSPITKATTTDNITHLLSDQRVPNHILPPKQIKLQNYRSLGQISGVVTRRLENQNPNHELIIIHRGPNRWTANTFNDQFIYQDEKTFLTVDPVLHLNPITGEILQMWGKNLFILPHSITLSYHSDSVEHSSNVQLIQPTSVWITDVALHQVMKFDWGKWDKPSLILGTAGQPGNGRYQFCQPTDVVITSTGDILISDGYCNSRIMKFTSNGTYLTEWSAMGSTHHKSPYRMEPRSAIWPGANLINQIIDNVKSGEYSFKIVHSLALIPADEQNGYLEQVCAADRENAAVLCYTTDGILIGYYSESALQPSVFAIEYDPVHKLIIGVTGKIGPGSTDASSSTQDLWTDPTIFLLKPIRPKHINEIMSIEEVFKYDNSPLVGFALAAGVQSPHDLTVSPNGDMIYLSEINPDRIFQLRIEDQQEIVKYDLQGFATAFVQKITTFSVHNMNSSQLIGLFMLLLIFMIIIIFGIVRLCRFSLMSNNNLRHHVSAKNKLTPKKSSLKHSGTNWFKRSAKNVRKVGFRPLIRSEETPDYFAEGVEEDEDDEDNTGEQMDEDVIMEPYKEQTLLRTLSSQNKSTMNQLPKNKAQNCVQQTEPHSKMKKISNYSNIA